MSTEPWEEVPPGDLPDTRLIRRHRHVTHGDGWSRAEPNDRIRLERDDIEQLFTNAKQLSGTLTKGIRRRFIKYLIITACIGVSAIAAILVLVKVLFFM